MGTFWNRVLGAITNKKIEESRFIYSVWQKKRSVHYSCIRATIFCQKTETEFYEKIYTSKRCVNLPDQILWECMNEVELAMGNRGKIMWIDGKDLIWPKYGPGDWVMLNLE